MLEQLTSLQLSVRAANAAASAFPMTIGEALNADLKAHLDVHSNRRYRGQLDAIVIEVQAACFAELAELQGLN